MFFTSERNIIVWTNFTSEYSGSQCMWALATRISCFSVPRCGFPAILDKKKTKRQTKPAHQPIYSYRIWKQVAYLRISGTKKDPKIYLTATHLMTTPPQHKPEKHSSMLWLNSARWAFTARTHTAHSIWDSFIFKQLSPWNFWLHSDVLNWASQNYIYILFLRCI